MIRMALNSTTAKDYFPTRTFLISAILLKCLLAIMGITTNLSVVLHNVKRSKTPADYLILNLGIADLTTCVVYYPTLVTEYVLILAGVDTNEELFCRVGLAIVSSTVVLSILTLLAITVDRYYFIATPFKYPLVMTKKKVRVVIGLIWLLALALPCLPAIYANTSEKQLKCPVDYSVTVSGSVIFVHIPAALVVYFNYNMFRIAQHHRRRIAQQSGIAKSTIRQSENNDENKQVTRIARAGFIQAFKSIKTFATVTGVFVLCYLPYSITVIVGTLLCEKLMCIPFELLIILSDLVSLCSILNPFIYKKR